MSVAQHLYEQGLITYMRTDSVNLSKQAIGQCKEEIIKLSVRNIRRHIITRQNQRRTGSPRGDPPVVYRAADDRRHSRRKEVVRPDLEADGRLADGSCGARPHHDRHRYLRFGRPVRRHGRSDPFRRIPETLLGIHGRGAGRRGIGHPPQNGPRRERQSRANYGHGTLHRTAGPL